MQARRLKEIASEVAKLEAAIAAQVKATPHFIELAGIIESVPGLGKATSAGLIAAMSELGQVSDNIAAALLGVAPYDEDSGQRRGNRHIKGGRRKVRNLFYMACLGAATSTTLCSRRFMIAWSPKERRRRLRSPPACASSSASQHHDRVASEMGR